MEVEPEIIYQRQGQDARKAFNVFFCFALEDNDFVTKLIEKLEADPYNLVCFNPHRNLLRKVFELQHYMQASQTCVLIISPSSLKSDWCKTEKEIILSTSNDMMVPVLLGDCDVPANLQHLVYIRASDDIDASWFGLLTRALGYKVCSVCNAKGINKRADKTCKSCDLDLCPDCLHPVTPETRTHDTVSLPVSLVSHSRSHDRCPKHTRDSLGLYCQDCQEIGCTICVATKHRTCSSVVTISEAEDSWRLEMTKSGDLVAKELDKSIIETIEIRKRRSRLAQEMERVITKVKDTMDNLRKAIDDKERLVLDQIQQIVAADEEKLSEQETRNLDRLQKMNENRSKIRAATISPDPELVHDVKELCLNQSKSSSPENWQCLSQITVQCNQREISDSVSGLRFDVESSHDDSLQRDDSLQKPEDDGHCTPVLHGEIDAFKKEMAKRIISDMCVVAANNQNVIIITDSAREDVTGIYIKDGKSVQRMVDFSGNPPNSVTETGNHMIAVSLPQFKKIAVLQVLPTLEQDRLVNTVNAYTGLSSLSSALLLGGVEYKPSVDIFDLSGTVYKSISLISLVEYNRHISTTITGNVVVVDFLHNAVVCVNLNEDIIFKYDSRQDYTLASPKMIGTDLKGNVFVLNQGLITQISQNGTFVQHLFKGGDKMDGMCFDKTGKLFVFTSTGCLRWYKFK